MARFSRRTACAAALAWLASPRGVLAQTAARVARVGFLIEPPIDDAIEDDRARRVPRRPARARPGRGPALRARAPFGERQARRAAGAVDEILKLIADVVVAAFPATARAVRKVDTSVPVVAVAVDNPVETGLAQTIARPGGNVTGISSWGTELVAKRLQLLRDLAPDGTAGRRLAGSRRRDAVAARRRPVRWGRALGMRDPRLRGARPDGERGGVEAMARDAVSGPGRASPTPTPTRTGRGSTRCACATGCRRCGAAATS